MEIVKLQAQTVLPGQHSYDKEHQHGGHPELRADLVGQNRHENQDGQKEHQVSREV